MTCLFHHGQGAVDVSGRRPLHPPAYARDLFQTTGFGDTIDFLQIKRHYYVVHAAVNPTGIVPKGSTLSGWFDPHYRDQLGGRPFGEGTTPTSPPRDEMRTASSPSTVHRS